MEEIAYRGKRCSGEGQQQGARRDSEGTLHRGKQADLPSKLVLQLLCRLAMIPEGTYRSVLSVKRDVERWQCELWCGAQSCTATMQSRWAVHQGFAGVSTTSF